jgi:hypothetical protein
MRNRIALWAHRALITVCCVLVCRNVAATFPPSRIVVVGPRVRGEVVDEDCLRDFNPWRASFIDDSRGPVVGGRPECDAELTVLFFGTSQERAERLIYVVRYCQLPSGGVGYVYLPGPGEDWYTVNRTTVVRGGKDGKWYYGSPQWQRLMARILERGRAVR